MAGDRNDRISDSVYSPTSGAVPTSGDLPAVPDLDPAPLAVRERGWTWWVGGAISLAVLVVALFQLSALDFAQVRSIVPTSPLFWLVFAASYLVAPLADWIIFRRLWHIPASGFLALLRKLIGNELLLGYIGELYFYTWARRRTEITTAPFGAIKDVAIMSALAGNLITVIMLAFAYPLLGTLHLGIDGRTLLLSVTTILATSSALLFFRKSLFSLPGRDLRFVMAMHLLRIIASNGLNALAWHLVLPSVEYALWLLLSTLRLLLSRLPFMPNKDLVFAGLAVFLIGHDLEIGALMTFMASLILATHLVLGLGLVISEAVGESRK